MDRFIETVLDREGCNKHNALKGAPCFLIRKNEGFGHYAAICNKRAKRAGFVGEISAKALLGRKSA
jgi:hypothetical protein